MRIILVLLCVIVFLSSCDNDDHTVVRSECSTPATVRNFSGLDGCGYVFELSDGTIIEPHMSLYCGTPPLPKEITDNPLYKFHWVDGKKVRINYTVIDTFASICMAGKTATITCVQDLEPNKKCIDYVIDQIKSEAVRNPPAKIYESVYKKAKFYYIPPYCCDVYGTLLDEDCNVVCHPDGGLTGKGDGYCPEFVKELNHYELFWEDDRVKISD